MKKMLITLFIFMTVGCSSPGKPGLFYEWTQYKTGVEVEVVSMPKWKGGVDAILRLQDEGKYASMVIYNGGNVESHFGYVTKDNVQTWIDLYEGFLTWEPKDVTQKVKFTIEDNVSLFGKNIYEVEYSVKNSRKLFLMNHYNAHYFIFDYTNQAVDEENVKRLLDIYLGLRNTLK